MLILVPTFPFNIEKMKANRLLLVCIGILIFINVFLLLELNKRGKEGPPHPPKLYLALGMKGKEAQWADHEFQRHIREKDRLLNQQKSWRRKVSLDPNKSVQNQHIFAVVSRIQFQIDSCTFDHFIRVKEHCTKKQQKALNRVVRRMIDRTGKPGPNGRP